MNANRKNAKKKSENLLRTEGTRTESSSSRLSSALGAAVSGAWEAASSTPAAPASDDISSAIEASARSKIGSSEYANSDTHGGALACAAFASGALREAGVMKSKGSNSQRELEGILRGEGYSQVSSLDNAKKGDVIFWDPRPGGKHGHVGIIAGKDESGRTMTIDNDPGRRSPAQHYAEQIRMPVRTILRATGISRDTAAKGTSFNKSACSGSDTKQETSYTNQGSSAPVDQESPEAQSGDKSYTEQTTYNRGQIAAGVDVPSLGGGEYSFMADVVLPTIASALAQYVDPVTASYTVTRNTEGEQPFVRAEEA